MSEGPQPGKAPDCARRHLRATAACGDSTGPVDTGGMPDEIRTAVIAKAPLGRPGTPPDAAHLVDFLCSPQGGWINGQLLYSSGGFS